MPYVNIPQSRLAGGVAKIIGKLQGELSSRVLAQAGSIQDQFRVSGCPTTAQLAKINNKKQQLDKGISGIDKRLSKFKKLPKALKGPLAGLKAAIKVILILPIPQSVPPGFGIPVNITTKYADVLHLLKELVSQISELVESIETVLNTPTSQLSAAQNVIKRLDSAIKSCQTEAALREQLESGALDNQTLQDLGLLDDEEVFIFSKLGPILVGNGQTDGDGNTTDGRDNTGVTADTFKDLNKKIQNNNQGTFNTYPPFGVPGTKIGERRYLDPPGEWYTWTGLAWIGEITDKDLITELNKAISGRSTEEDGLDKAVNDLNESLRKLQDSNLPDSIKKDLKGLLNNFKDLSKKDTLADSRFFHTGPDGTVYELEIKPDLDSPEIAPRRFAVAKNPQGIEVLKGPKSFSSDTDVLLEEVKFRIDNQLP
jgi:chaperonin cofactor prefoldin